MSIMRSMFAAAALIGAASGAIADKIYVAASSSGVVYVVDAATNQITGSISVPSPVFIAVSPDGKVAYVTSSNNDLVFVDLVSNSVLASVPVGPAPAGVALNPAGTRAYVGVQFGSYVAVVDTASRSVVAQIPIPVHLATNVAVSPDGTRLYVGNQAGLVYVIDTMTNGIVASIPVGDFVGEIRVHPAGTYAYAAVMNSNYIAVIDTATNTVVATSPVGPGCTFCGPAGIAVDPLGEFVYSTESAPPNQVYKIRVSDHTAVAIGPATVNFDPFSSAIHPDGKSLYITSFTSGTLSVVATRSNTTVATIPIGNHPRGIAVVAAAPGVATPTGSNVAVSADAVLSDGSIATSVDLTFASVLAAGQTTITATAPLKGPPPPADFKLGSGNAGYYFDVSTTAVFSGPATICFEWQEGQFAREQSIRVLHYENGGWVNVTTSVDTVQNVACGSVTSLSPFGLLEQAYRFSGFFAPVDNPPVVNSVKAGQGVPVKFDLGGDHGLGIFLGAGPTSQAVNCTSGAPLDVVNETVSAGSSGLVYDAASGSYVYVWKTEKAWGNSCRQLSLTFRDGSTRHANFLLTK